MNYQDFNDVVESAITDLRETLSKKGATYSGKEDRLKNFKDAAELNHCLPVTALWGMVTKHIVALAQFIKMDEEEFEMVDYDEEACFPASLTTEREWREKIGDIRCYLTLLEGLLIDEGIYE